tara:strand:- start:119 stop:403 length:285 start_codon:yes stop_codon:yes gene_type:complete
MDNYININNKEEEEEEEYECLICFENVDIHLTYVKCHNCHKLFHRRCMDLWKKKKQQKYCVCVHCTKDDLLLHKTNITCCGCFKWSSKHITIYD